MVPAKEWTNTDSKDAKILALTTCLSKFDIKTSILASVQRGRGNRPHTCTNTKGREPNQSYVEELNNIVSWRFNKSKDMITRDVQDWYWFPTHKMEEKFDGMYNNHQSDKYDEMAEEIQKKRGYYKKAGPSIWRMVKTQLEIVEAKYPHSFLTYTFWRFIFFVMRPNCLKEIYLWLNPKLPWL